MDSLQYRESRAKLRLLTLVFVLLITPACRMSKQQTSRVEQHHFDSLSLWQWDELILVHERLDSTGTRATERSTLRWHKTQHLEQQQRQDSLLYSQATSKPSSVTSGRPLWLRLPWWIYLLSFLVVGVALVKMRPLILRLFRTIC